MTSIRKRILFSVINLREESGTIAESAALVLVFTALASIRRLFEMFGWGSFGNIQAAQQAALQALDPNIAKRKEAEDIINAEGKGVCEYCKEPIVKSDHSLGGGWTWESEFMLGFCHGAKDKKHHPLIRYTQEGGVQNVE